jgi:hypothetical protein
MYLIEDKKYKLTLNKNKLLNKKIESDLRLF